MFREGREHHRSPPGAAPGTLTVSPDSREPEIDIMTFGPDETSGDVSARDVVSADEILHLPEGHRVRWVNVEGVGNAEVIAKIGEQFGLHPLALEDIANVAQRPKAEAYDDHLFIVTRIPLNPPPAPGRPRPGPGEGGTANERAAPWTRHARHLATEQVAICVGKDFVITFQEEPGDVFEPVRNRLRNPNGRMRSRGADYLAYALLDAAIDSYFPLLEVYGEYVEDLEQRVVARPEFSYIADIHGLKRNLLTARRAVWPQRELLSALNRDESGFITDETKIFLRDCYDHTVQLIDMIETYREIASGLVDVQLSSASTRMNEVMKVLTVIATIFIPLTFVAGVYGMNFNPEAGAWNMPELDWAFGYPATLLAMAAIAGGLLFWFRRKGWLGSQKPREGPPGRR